MPNYNDNNDLPDLSIEKINDLYSDIIEFPDDNRISGVVRGSQPNTAESGGSACGGGK